MDEKATFRRYLDSLRTAVVWKAEGLKEWQLRWPMTSTGTTVLGVIKHLAAMEYGYLGLVFGRPGEDLPWIGPDAEPNADMWATAEESVEDILSLYRRAVAHADATIEALPLDAKGHVPWWPEPEVTLHRILVHLSVEVARHAGHLDIVREGLDGRVGMNPTNSNLPFADWASWADYADQLRGVAVEAQWPGATVGEYVYPGPQRDKLLAPILSGEKTATSSLLQAYRATGEALPAVGQREVVLDSRNLPVAITETTDVRVVPIDEVDLDHVLDEGEGFSDVAAWRAAHEAFWTSQEVRAELDDPDFVIDDDTQVVLQRIRVVEHLGLPLGTVSGP